MAQNQNTQVSQSNSADNKNNTNQITGKDVSDLCAVFAKQIDKIVEQRISKAEFDKTYYGLISKVYFTSETPRDTKEYQCYQIKYNGYAQDVYIRDEIIHSVGDRVMVTLPNGKLSDKFVRVLTPNPHPIKIELSSDEKKITETWTNAVGTEITREFLLEKDDNGNYSKITFPDGSVMDVTGF